jgi:hypothetical protein
MFKSDLDAIFLQSLIPLKTPPTMLSSVQNQSAGSSSASSTMSSHNMPLPPSQLPSNVTFQESNHAYKKKENDFLTNNFFNLQN